MFASARCISLFSVVIIVLAVFYKVNYDDSLLLDRLQNVLNGLLRAEKHNITHHERPRIAVGFGGCFDAFLPALNGLKELQLHPTGVREHHDVVKNGEDFEQLFNYFFYHGAASE